MKILVLSLCVLLASCGISYGEVHNEPSQGVQKQTILTQLEQSYLGSITKKLCKGINLSYEEKCYWATLLMFPVMFGVAEGLFYPVLPETMRFTNNRYSSVGYAALLGSLIGLFMANFDPE